MCNFYLELFLVFSLVEEKKRHTQTQTHKTDRDGNNKAERTLERERYNKNKIDKLAGSAQIGNRRRQLRLFC